MKKNRDWIIISICVVATFFIWQQVQQYKSEIVSLESLVNSEQIAKDQLETLLYNAKQSEMANWLQALVGLNYELTVTSSNKEGALLKDIVKGKTFIFHFESEMCSSCIDKEFLNLNVLADTFGKDKIIILAQGYRQAYLQQADQFSKWQNQIYIVDNNPFANGELLITPTISVLRNNKPSIVYHAPKSTNDSFEALLSVLKQVLP